MGDAHFSAEGATVRSTRREISRFFAQIALALALVPTALLLVVLALSPSGERWWLTDLLGDLWLCAWILCMPVVLLISFFAGKSTRRPSADIEVDGGELRLHSAWPLTIPIRELVGASFVDAEEPEVEIVVADGDLLHVGLSQHRARALIGALGFASSGRRTVVQFGG